MTTLVTGAPGWLGTRLVEELVRQGRSVRCLVETGMEPGTLYGLPVEIANGDVRNADSLLKAMVGVDIVFHCAGVIHPKAVSDLYAVNTRGTENMLRTAVAEGIGKFVYVSSISAQGVNINDDQLMAEDQPCRPESDYGRSKYLAEQLVIEYRETHGLATVIVRPPIMYGPGQPARWTRLMRMVRRETPLVFGDGHNLRSMVYIDNAISALLLAEGHPAATGRTYYIGDQRPYTTLEILETIASVLRVRFRPIRIPVIAAKACGTAARALGRVDVYSTELHVVGESYKTIACGISKAKEELGYEPKVSLRLGMQTTIEWCLRQGHL
jgi:nucleoside-diphosphate-sugar epimerase